MKILSSCGHLPVKTGVLSVVILALLLTGYTALLEGMQPVSEFDIKRYQGKWYEIARTDNRFEHGIAHATANYALRG